MTLKTFLLRLLACVLVIAGGTFAYALTFHILLKMGVVPAALDGKGFGYVMTDRTAYVIMGASVLGLASIFIRAGWRLILLFAPLYAPVLFAIAFTAMHQDLVTPATDDAPGITAPLTP